MKRVSAASSRGCSTTAPDTVAAGDTAPSCSAPCGIRGLGATILVPVGAAAPAPAAEIPKHTAASSGAATSVRRPRPLLMQFLLIAATAPPPGARPQTTGPVAK